jgi:hypothetical protein
VNITSKLIIVGGCGGCGGCGGAFVGVIGHFCCFGASVAALAGRLRRHSLAHAPPATLVSLTTPSVVGLLSGRLLAASQPGGHLSAAVWPAIAPSVNYRPAARSLRPVSNCLFAFCAPPGQAGGGRFLDAHRRRLLALIVAAAVAPSRKRRPLSCAGRRSRPIDSTFGRRPAIDQRLWWRTETGVGAATNGSGRGGVCGGPAPLVATDDGRAECKSWPLA